LYVMHTLSTNRDLQRVLRFYKQHQEWYEQTKRKEFVTPEWKKEWLSMYPQPRIYFLRTYLGDIEKFKKELERKGEYQPLRGTLEPEKLLPKEYLKVLNLLIERINEHDRKVIKDRIKAEKEERQKQRISFPTKDKRDDRLFPIVCYSYEVMKDQANKFKGFIIRREMASSYAKRYYREHRKELEQEYEQKYDKAISKSKHKKSIKTYLINEVFGKIMHNDIKIPRSKLRLPKDGNLYMRNDKLYVREGIPEERKITLNKELESLQRLTIPTLKEAIEKINKQRKIFPEKTFERDKEKIYNRFKRYHMKQKAGRE